MKKKTRGEKGAKEDNTEGSGVIKGSSGIKPQVGKKPRKNKKQVATALQREGKQRLKANHPKQHNMDQGVPN